MTHPDDARFDGTKPCRTVSRNGRSFDVVRSDSEFWRIYESGEWEPATLDVFDRLFTSETVFLDIGAWIGPTSLYGAQLAKATYSFEPDPIAYRTLSDNVRANAEASWSGRIEILNVAVARVAGSLDIGSRAGGGDSMSSELFAGERTTWRVNAISLPEFTAAHGLEGERLFLKVDIEGGEYSLVPALTNFLGATKSDLLLSIHPQFLAIALRKTNGSTIAARIKSRLQFTWCHVRLVRSLPYRHVSGPDGSGIGLRRQIVKALVFGRFPTELLGTYRPR